MYLHLVLVTKYRRRVLTVAAVDRCREILADTAAAWGCSVLESEGEADHVHVLLEVLPRVRPNVRLEDAAYPRLPSRGGGLRGKFGHHTHT